MHVRGWGEEVVGWEGGEGGGGNDGVDWSNRAVGK